MERHDHIASQRKFASAREAVAAHCGNRGFGALAQQAEYGRRKAVEHVPGLTRHHFFKVSTRTEGLFAAADDDAAHFVVLEKQIHSIGQLTQKAIIQCVEGLGAVEFNDADVIFDAGDYHIVGHRVSFL